TSTTTATATTAGSATSAGSATGSASAAASASPSGTAGPGAGTPTDGSYYSTATVPAGTTLDMHRELYRGNADIVSLQYNNLIGWQDMTSQTIEGEIAEKWEQPDHSTVVFTLRAPINWQNKPPA